MRQEDSKREFFRKNETEKNRYVGIVGEEEYSMDSKLGMQKNEAIETSGQTKSYIKKDIK